MKTRSSFQCGFLALCVLVLAGPTSAQTKTQKPAEQDDVIRVSTELVQTDVMVFDKKGHFVDGLRGDQFALKVDNKPTSISFFERVTSGKENTTRNPGVTGPVSTSSPGPAIVRGRTVIFFVDDLHLAPDSLVRTRKALLEFIDRGMTEKDQVAITSSSGQIGFLQQFTDDKIALQTAVARLNNRTNTKMDMDSPPMSEYIASKIREGDQQTINYYVKELEKQNCFRPPGGGGMICMMTPQGMVAAVRMRAQEMTVMAAPDTDNTLIMLEGLMRTAGQLP